MKTSKNKIISLFFILLGFTPLLIFLFFDIQQETIRHRMEEKLKQNSLKTIVLPAREVIWVDKHEIWVNESMFDIHSFSLNNGIYTFTGLYDEEETGLVKQRDRASEGNEEENKLLSQFLKWLELTYDTNKNEEAIFPHNSKRLASFNPFSFIRLLRKVPTPPPRCRYPYC